MNCMNISCEVFCLRLTTIIHGIGLIVLIVCQMSESIHDKECILPEENTKNHTFGKCILFTHCEFKLENNSYVLETDQILFLPNIYMTDFYGNNCPRYYDLPGYIYFTDIYQKDIGYGYCETPFDTMCSQALYNMMINQFDENTAGEVVYNNHITSHLSYAKTDEAGTNCPGVKDMMCIDYQSTYDTPIFISGIILFILVIMNMCGCMPTNQSYNPVTTEPTDKKLQGTV